MATRLNTEFNYRTQVIGETPWEKIKTLKGFLEGRKRAAVLEEVSKKKYQAKLLELENLRSIPALPHIILNLEAEIIEIESFLLDQKEAFILNKRELETVKNLLAELYAEVEPTRIPGYDDDMMFELNSINEFTVMIARDMHAEIIANGRPSATKIRNAMSNPYTWKALQSYGLLPTNAVMIEGNTDPTLPLELKIAPMIDFTVFLKNTAIPSLEKSTLKIESKQ